MSKVGVLEALDGAIAQTEYHNAERANGGDARNRPLREARAAVAELIEAAKEFSDLYGYLWDVVEPDGAGFLSPESVKKYDDAHGKLMAALASCVGAK